MSVYTSDKECPELGDIAFSSSLVAFGFWKVITRDNDLLRVRSVENGSHEVCIKTDDAYPLDHKFAEAWINNHYDRKLRQVWNGNKSDIVEGMAVFLHRTRELGVVTNCDKSSHVKVLTGDNICKKKQYCDLLSLGSTEYMDYLAERIELAKIYDLINQVRSCPAE